MTYRHDDDRCAQDSLDAVGFRDACRQIARLANALHLPDTGCTIGEVVDTAIARLPTHPAPTSTTPEEA
jgi:hypothetical protein